MSNLKKVYVLSKILFDRTAKINGLNDDNVELLKDTAFISIVNTNRYGDDDMNGMYDCDYVHWFKKNHDNVLNLEFDDIDNEAEDCKVFSEEQAKDVIEFIGKNENKTFLIHCFAGISRSGAIGLFLRDFYSWVDKEWFDINIKPKIGANQKVFMELKKIFYCRNRNLPD